ncbi:hypothetical protein [Puerhibacterium puerhi]|uniref:hypothetical protein n=1 Tax=Puerhibacterium puerhi TaxID=2692623 RepID=UPI00135A9A25|nr:hypothetical protein [Puerhibacterium puerhi]
MRSTEKRLREDRDYWRASADSWRRLYYSAEERAEAAGVRHNEYRQAYEDAGRELTQARDEIDRLQQEIVTLRSREGEAAIGTVRVRVEPEFDKSVLDNIEALANAIGDMRTDIDLLFARTSKHNH